MKPMSLILGVVVLMGAVAALAAGGTEGAAGAKPRIGTFDARAVALAYYRSPLHDELLKSAMAEHKQAKEAGDSKRAKAIEAQRSAEQEQAHWQVFGSGPYDTLAEKLKPVWGKILEGQNVDAIVPKVYASGEGLETIDVTEAILAALRTDQKTREIIADMREKIRTGKYDPAKFKGEE